MITKTKQDWTPGNIVKVGFLRLRVLGARAVKDGLPDIYTLESVNGTVRYEFIPHHGIRKLYDMEATQSYQTYPARLSFALFTATREGADHGK